MAYLILYSIGDGDGGGGLGGGGYEVLMQVEEMLEVGMCRL